MTDFEGITGEEAFILANEIATDPPNEAPTPVENMPPDEDLSLNVDELPRVIVVGSGTWPNHATIQRELMNWWEANGRIAVYFQVDDTPAGAAPMIIQTLETVGLPYEVWHADRISPEARDRAMVAAGAVLAFVFIDEESIGASRVKDLCIGAGIPTIVNTRRIYRPTHAWEER